MTEEHNELYIFCVELATRWIGKIDLAVPQILFVDEIMYVNLLLPNSEYHQDT